MKTVELKVGIKGADAIKVPCPIAESVDDMLKLAKGNQDVVVRCFNRGFRIEAQEKSGARDTFRELTEQKKGADEIRKAVSDKVANFDPTVSQPRSSGPRKPRDVKIDPAKKSYSPDEFRELLAAAGVKVNFVDQNAPAAQAASGNTNAPTQPSAATTKAGVPAGAAK